MRLRAELAELRRRRTPEPDASTSVKARADAPSAGTTSTPRPSDAPKASPPAPAVAGSASVASAEAKSLLDRAKADVLQIADAAKRESGLVALGELMRSPDRATARAALLSLAQLRDVTYDKSRFRDDVLPRIQDPDPTVRTAAAYALMQLDRNEADLDRVLTAAEAEEAPTPALLHVAMMLSKNRVEGRLETLFVKALAVDDARRGAMDTANYLRGIWVSPATEDAVVAAWRRHPTDAGGSTGLWPYVLGQMQPAPRESRVQAIFDMLAPGDDSVRQLAGVAIERTVDETARPVAAQLAAAGIATAPTAALRRTYLQCIQTNGGREQLPALRALAENSLVGEDLRALAAKIADDLERRR